MSSVIVDVETTGIPKNYNYTDIDAFKNARMVQLSFILTDFNDIYEEFNYIIKRNDFNINNSHIHGITNEISDNQGIDIEVALNRFIEVSNDKTVYAHNAKFDIAIIKSELMRLNKQYNPLVVCTMLKYSKQKYLKLTELYYQTFNEHIKQDHNSINDCIILYKILKNRLN
jgi:DNA polymerase III epsilon subunit-like protein